MEVVDNIPIISLCNGIMVSKVPLDVVAEGLIQLLFDAGQVLRWKNDSSAWLGTTCSSFSSVLAGDNESTPYLQLVQVYPWV